MLRQKPANRPIAWSLGRIVRLGVRVHHDAFLVSSAAAAAHRRGVQRRVAAWVGAGALVVLEFLLTTGGRPDAPFPLLFGAFGVVAGVVFSGVLSLVEAVAGSNAVTVRLARRRGPP